MIRSVLTLVLSLWLVAGCAAAPVSEAPRTPERDFLAYCQHVMPEVRAFLATVDEMERTQDDAYFDDLLDAARAIDDISSQAREGLRGARPTEGEWLRELGLAARGFHTMTIVEVDEGYVADRLFQILGATERATLRCAEGPA
jgi:hypothetical protein